MVLPLPIDGTISQLLVTVKHAAWNGFLLQFLLLNSQLNYHKSSLLTNAAGFVEGPNFPKLR